MKRDLCILILQNAVRGGDKNHYQHEFHNFIPPKYPSELARGVISEVLHFHTFSIIKFICFKYLPVLFTKLFYSSHHKALGFPSAFLYTHIVTTARKLFHALMCKRVGNSAIVSAEQSSTKPLTQHSIVGQCHKVQCGLCTAKQEFPSS